MSAFVPVAAAPFSDYLAIAGLISPPTVANASIATLFETAGTATLTVSGVYDTIAIVSQPANGTATISGLVVTYTPTGPFSGADSFTVRATNSAGDSNLATVSVSVGLPSAPVVTAPSPLAVVFNTPTSLTFAISGYYTGVAVSTAPVHGTLVVSGLTATYTPTTGYVGGDTFSIVATNSGGSSAPASVVVSVAAPAASDYAPAPIHTRFAATAARLIRKFTTGGVTLSYETSAFGSDPTDATSVRSTSIPIPAVVEGYSDAQVDGDTILVGDRRIYLAANDVTQIPTKGWVVTIDGVGHTIVNVQQVMAAGKISLYILQARTANR